MSLSVPDTKATLARLEAALDAPGIPSRAATGCRLLIDKLRRPVQLGLFGLPGSGKAVVLNALAGQTVAPTDLSLPTLELSHGAELGLTAILQDGSSIARPGLPGPDIEDEDPVFVRVTTPEPTMRGLTVLNVVAEKDEEDQHAALNWAAQRCDIALWCTQFWTDFEQRTWHQAPHQLKNHALMIVTREAKRSQVQVSPRDEFEKVLFVPPLKVHGLSGVAARLRAEDLTHLVSQVRKVIHEAVSEDVDSALMFLHRYERASMTPATPPAPASAPEPSAAPKAAAPAAPPAKLAPAPIPFPAPPPAPEPISVSPLPDPALPDEQEASPEAIAALSRAFQYLRQRASKLLDDAPIGTVTPEQAPDLLAQFEDAVVSLVAFTEFEQSIAETWPDLNDTLIAANEFALLLRIEGGAEQVVDAAALLLQLREEMELKLAA